MKWLKANKVSDLDLFLADPGTKAFWVCKSQLEIIDDILFYVWEDPPISRKLLMVPKALQKEVLRLCHDTPMAGHLGIKYTIKKIKESFIWHGITQSVTKHVSGCTQCNSQKKASVKAKAPLQHYQASAPMERVHIDILGPFILSTSGNLYILMMIDQFTKWFECQAIPDQKAETVAKALVDSFISRFGCPIQIFTDQGKNFDGQLFASLCQLLDVSKLRTTPYHPAANGQIERYNRTIMQMIRCHLKENQRNWDSHLQQLAAAIRATPNRQTGYTANMLMLGREVYQPADLVFGTHKLKFKIVPYENYIDNLKENQYQMQNLARSHLKEAQRRQKRYYDANLFVNKYEVGNVVYRLNEASKIGESEKLKSPWIGPYLIVSVLSPVLVKIRARNRDFVVHHNSLKPCKDTELPIWLLRARNKLLNQPDNRFESQQQPFDGENDELHLNTLFGDNVPEQVINKIKINKEILLPSLNIPVQETRVGRKTSKPKYFSDYTS